MHQPNILPISVLMSVYKNDDVAHLQCSLDSIFNQSCKPAQVIVVIDGWIPKSVMSCLKESQTRFDILEIVHLTDNCGLAKALNYGSKFVKYPYIARMDADDISVPNRLEEQLLYLEKHNLDFISSWQGDFESDPAQIYAIKKCPEDHEDIVAAIKWRSIMCHPSLLFKTEIMKKVGGYPVNFGNLEDHGFFVRVIKGGYKLGCIPKIHLKVRVNLEQRIRRGGVQFLRYEWALRKSMWKTGYLNFFEFIISYSVIATFKLLPGRVRNIFYTLVRERTHTVNM